MQEQIVHKTATERQRLRDKQTQRQKIIKTLNIHEICYLRFPVHIFNIEDKIWRKKNIEKRCLRQKNLKNI